MRKYFRIIYFIFLANLLSASDFRGFKLDTLPCDNFIYNQGCISDCKYIPENFEKVVPKLKWVTKNLTKDNDFLSSYLKIVVSDSFLFTRSTENLGNLVINSISKIRKIDGVILSKINIDTSVFSADRDILSLKFKNKSYLITTKYEGDVICYENEKIKWVNSDFKWKTELTANIRSADFNQDDIPEIYFADKIINFQNGKTVFNGKLSKGCNFYSIFTPDLCNSTSSIACDLTNHKGLEFACGNIVYEIDFNNLNDTLGNTFKSLQAPSGVKDGFTSVADIDLDGLLDIVVVRSNLNSDGDIWVWDPRKNSIIAFTKRFNQKGKAGSIATIQDLDNDCYPEIIVTFEKKIIALKYIKTDSLATLFDLPTTDKSGFTATTVFDLNNDGVQEIFYRDETELKILNGPDGKTVFSFPVYSFTWMEYPVICDIDDDNEAEILISGGISTPDSVSIFCFESSGSPWAPARKVWNQSGYHITNVNDDLTIPRQEQNNAAFFDTDSCGQKTCNQPYNTFMCQATYRDQNGCVRWPAVDMVTDVIDYTCMGDSITLRVEVRSESTNEFKQDSVNIALYQNQNALPFYIKQLPWTKKKIVDTISYTMSSLGINKIRARVNIPDISTSFVSNIKGLTQVLECDYENNVDSIAINIAKKSIDLGPDIIKCPSEVFTLHAGSGFISYQWSDGSQDSIFSTSFIGLHSVTVTDVCGRKYSDEVEFKPDPLAKENIGSDITKCIDEVVTYSVNGNYDWIKWLPKNAVDCDTCKSVKVVADTSFLLIMVGSKNGCVLADSAVIKINKPTSIIKQASVCKGDSILFYSKYISKAGSYNHKVGSCDSLITLDLKILKPDSTSLKKELCKGDSILFLGKWYDKEINASFKTKNTQGCDSIIAFELRLIDTLKSMAKYDICQSDSIKINNTWLKKAGLYKYNFTSGRGCDSLLTVEIKSLPDKMATITKSICKGDSVLIANKWIKSEGSISLITKANNGCDSTTTAILSYLASPVTNVALSLCNGDSIKVFGKYVKQAGSFSKIEKSILGCDSTSNVVVTFFPKYNKTDSIAICQGDSVFINNKWIKTAGTYIGKNKTKQGCDSIVNSVVKISQLIAEIKNTALCEGDSLLIKGKWIKQAGTYIDTMIATQGCKKVLTTKVNIVSKITKSADYTLCPDASINIGGAVIDSAGIYNFKNKTSLGCDSIFTANVTKLTWPAPPMIDINCTESLYTASISTSSPWQHTWSTNELGNTTTIVNGGLLSTKVFTASGCEKTYSYDLPNIPNINDIPIFQDIKITSNSYPLTVNLDAKEWKIKWSPSSFISCDSCFQTTINTSVDTTINITLTHISGCTFTRSFYIDVTEKINITFPNIFCPSCTTNKEWTINMPEGYKIIDLAIYDRWGSNVASYKNAQTISWDGTMNGKSVVSGVYAYTIRYTDANGILYVRVGDVTVVR